MRARRAGELAQRHCEPRQRTEQDIGEDQIVAGTRGDCRCPGAGTDREGDQRCNAVKPRIASRRVHRDRVNVASDDARPHQSSRCYCQHASPGADIKHALCAPSLGQIGKREEAAVGRAMVTGPEGEGGLNFDADIVGPHVRAIVRAVNNKAAHAHRFEAGKALRNPVGCGDRFDTERLRRRFAGHKLDESAQSGLVGGGAKMDRDLPSPVIAFECRTDGVLGAEAFAEIGREPAGSRFVAGEASDSGGRIHVPQVCPSHSCAQWLCRRL